MVQRSAKYNPRRVNNYVPAMQYNAAVVHAAPYEVDLGAPAVAAANNILAAQSIATAGSTSTLLIDNVDPVVVATSALYPYGPGFGRCLQVVASGAATSTVTITGRDYLGQPMIETLTLNGATPVIGTKAFKWLDLVAWGATGGTTINLGTTDKLGLPFKTKAVLAEFTDGVSGTVGTLVTPSLVDPATATTTDPRGTYDPNVVLNGTKVIKITVLLGNSVNASGNGGLYGLPHYFA